MPQTRTPLLGGQLVSQIFESHSSSERGCENLSKNDKDKPHGDSRSADAELSYEKLDLEAW
jgi:hypothetical protein